MGQQYRLKDGTIVEAQPDGTFHEVVSSGAMRIKPPDPKLPFEGPQAAATLTRTRQEIRQSEATAGATTRKTNAEATKAELEAKAAEEQWKISHPQNDPTQGMSGPAYLQYLEKSDPGRAAYIKGLAEGRVPFPGAQMMRSPAGQALLTQVMRADPTIDATNYATRAAARKNAATGKLSDSDNALITAIGHASMLGDLVPQVYGSKIRPFNSIANAVDSNLFGGKQPEYDQNAHLLGDEVAKAYGGGAVSDRSDAATQFDSSLATNQKLDNIQHAVELMASKLAANRAQFAYGNGQLGKPDFMLLPEQTRKELMDIPGGKEIAAKYFGGIPSLGPNDGNGPPPPPGGLGGAPMIAPGGPQGAPPTADYSAMTGGNQAGLAATDPNSKLGAFQQTYRTEFNPEVAGGLSALIRKGLPYEQAAAYLQSQGFIPPKPDDYNAALAYQKQHPGAAPNVEATRQVPTSLWNRLSSSPGAAFTAGAASGATAGLSDVAGREFLGPAWDANRAALAGTHGAADLLGNVAGGAGTMAFGGGAVADLMAAGAKGGFGRNALAWAARNPIKAAIPGDAAYGAVYGASEKPNNPLAGAGVGALGGMFGSAAGGLATKGAGKLLTGVTNPAVQRLKDAGIPLTVGEVLGGGAKKAQDAMTSIFGPGNMVARRYADGRQALNEAAFNQGGQIIGAPINAVGNAGIQALNTAKNNAYSNALDPVSLDLTTPAFQSMRGTLDSAANSIPDVKDARGIATGGLSTYIDNAAPEGVMNGRAFQEGYRGLSRLGNQPDTQPFGYEIGQVAKGGKLALGSALQDQNPGAYEGFLRANTANRNLNVLSDAVNAAKNQIGDNGQPMFTPAQLGTAATNNAKRYEGNISAASGNRPFNQLINDSQQVMSSKLPESGTYPRALLGAALMGGGGGMFGGKEGGYDGAAEGALTPLALLTLLGTRRGQQLLTGSLLNRTATDRFTGKLLMRNPQVGGDLLTAAGSPLLAGY